MLEPRHDAALEQYVKREWGMPSPATPYLASCPWVVRALVRLGFDHGLLLRLDLDFADLVALVVCQEHSCRFCYAAHRALLRFQGMSEARVQELEGRLSRSDVEPRLVAALVFARRMSRSAPLICAEDRDKLFAAGSTARKNCASSRRLWPIWRLPTVSRPFRPSGPTASRKCRTAGSCA